MRFAMRFPEALRPGDRVAVVAPASPFDRDEFFRGLAWLAGRYKLVVKSQILSRAGYLAGSDARRTRELSDAMEDPSVRAIVGARGGYGTIRLVASLPWASFAASPKWLVGFSDLTALHAYAWKRGIASVHGPHVTGLGGGATPWCRARWMGALEEPHAAVTWCGLLVLAPGAGPAEGPIVGGNLALLEALAAAGQLEIPQGAILAIEDVTERPYRIDRMLTALRLGGYVARANAIVFGGFTRCDPGADGLRVERVLAEFAAGLGIPVVAGAPFGHDARNDAFVMGQHARVEGATVRIGRREGLDFQ